MKEDFDESNDTTRQINIQAIADQLCIRFSSEKSAMLEQYASKLECKMFVSSCSAASYQMSVDRLVNTIFESDYLFRDNEGSQLDEKTKLVFIRLINTLIDEENPSQTDINKSDHSKRDVKHDNDKSKTDDNEAHIRALHSRIVQHDLLAPREHRVVETARGQQGCVCRNTNCIKKYCVCFAQNAYCDPNVCRCTNCHNTVELSARPFNSLKEFTNKIEGTAQETAVLKCRCKRSQCLKLYCDCRAANKLCTELCECQDCHNNQ